MLKGLIYPPVCTLCGKIVGGEKEKYCQACQKRLENRPKCYRTDGEFFDLCLSAFAFEEPLAETLRNMKRRKHPARANLLAKALEALVEEQGLTFDYITCVPVHWRQKLTRGLNHSEEIAMRLAKYTRIPYCRILQKHLRNKRQSSLSQKERKANVYGVYRMNRRWEGQLTGKTVLVVDDIVTTGSTLGEVARILKMSGANRVLCITVAKSISK